MTSLKEANPKIHNQEISFPSDALKLKCPMKMIIRQKNVSLIFCKVLQRISKQTNRKFTTENHATFQKLYTEYFKHFLKNIIKHLILTFENACKLYPCSKIIDTFNSQRS